MQLPTIGRIRAEVGTRGALGGGGPGFRNRGVLARPALALAVVVGVEVDYDCVVEPQATSGEAVEFDDDAYGEAARAGLVGD